jgi:hypothetical protein
MKLVHFSIRVTPQLKRLIRRDAKDQQVGTSAVVRAILMETYAATTLSVRPAKKARAHG